MTSRAARVETAAVALLVAAHALLAWLQSGPTNDDAFISFRYARNLVEGHGLVFNPGERVEGYTNFLWTLLLAALLPVADPVVASKVLGVLASSGVVVMAAVLGRDQGRAWGLAAASIVALDPALLRWSTRGLETSLFALLVLATLLASRTGDHPARAGIAALLATLTRPEGLVAAAAVGGAALGREARWRFLRTYGATFLAGLLPYLAFKLAYYGDLLPNTYYAKSGGGVFQLWRGIAYVVNGWGAPELWLGAIAIAGAASRRARRETLPAALMAGMLLAAVVQEGGDSLGPDRFLAPAVAPLAVAAARGAGRLAGARWAVRAAILVAAIPVASRLPALADGVRHPAVWTAAFEDSQPGTGLGRCLGRLARPGDSIATSLIGRVPYYSRLHTLDAFGLVDRHIARLPAPGGGAAGHEKSDPDYILSRRPTFIMASGRIAEVVVAPPRERPWLAALRRAVSGEPPGGKPRMLKPPFPGYEPVALPCEGGPRHVWRRVDRDPAATPEGATGGG